MEPPAGTWLKTSLSDLSLSGCYVDTLHPLPVGTVEQKRPDGLAELLFDSFLQPVLEGVRSSSIGTRQMLYRADPFQIDLLIESQAGGPNVVVTGQLLDLRHPEIVGHDLRVTLSNLRGRVVQAAINQFG